MTKKDWEHLVRKYRLNPAKKSIMRRIPALFVMTVLALLLLQLIT